MIRDTIQIKPRYGEVDQMGYVYHSNHIIYCHQARTELMRKYGIEDSALERKNILLAVVDFQIRYKCPARYDENLTVHTTLNKIAAATIHFEFEMTNDKNELICAATSMVAFLNRTSRRPARAPAAVKKAFPGCSG